MVARADTLSNWLAQAHVPEARLTAEQRAVLQAAWHFRQQQGADYYSSRLLGHFLLHCGSGLKVAQIARLVGVSRPTASGQQGQSSKEVIQTAHHRLDGRPYGKLLPRFAGPIAEFLLTHPGGTRYDVLDFIQRTFEVRVSTVALHHFLKRYGLDGATRQAARSRAASPAAEPPGSVAVVPATAPAPPFSRRARNTPAPSC